MSLGEEYVVFLLISCCVNVDIISIIMYIEYSNNGGKSYSVCIADITLCGEYQFGYVLVPDSGSGVSKA